MGGVLFHPIYWQTACLLQRSGALTSKSANHNKIAKAVATISSQGVNIQPVDVNASEKEFALDVEKNIINFGLNGVKGLKAKVVENILELRPFSSFDDFVEKTKADISSLVAIAKSGGFDKFIDREEIPKILADRRSGKKTKLNGQNLSMISKRELWPTHTDELAMSLRVFNFTQYLKIISKNNEDKEIYNIDDRAMAFLEEIEFPIYDDTINKSAWKPFYDVYMVPIKNYIIEHQDELLTKLNAILETEWIEKYFPHSDLAYGEIEGMGLNFSPHPYLNIDNVTDFNTLTQSPEPTLLNIKGKRIPVFDLTMIAGLVIAKDKQHSTVTVLTATGPVEIKFRKQQFAVYDKQVSRIIDGKKKVIEKSWFTRGVGLIVHGMRQDDLFLAKVYKKSPMHHTVYKITDVLDDKFKVQKERAKGTLEEENESEE